MNEILKGILMIGGIFILVITFTQPLTAEYINRPFGMECRENISISYGNLKSCGDLMSEDTTKIGLGLIFFGLPLLAFVILPIFKKLKIKRVKNEKG